MSHIAIVNGQPPQESAQPRESAGSGDGARRCLAVRRPVAYVVIVVVGGGVVYGLVGSRALPTVAAYPFCVLAGS